MPEVVNCPKCGNKARVPEELLGREVRCPGCGEVFTAAVAAPAASSPPAEDRPGEDDPQAVRDSRPGEPARRRRTDDDEDDRPRRRRRGRSYELDDPDDEDDDRGGRRRYTVPDRGPLVLILGIMSIVVTLFACVLCGPLGVVGLGTGIPAWIMGRGDLARMRAGEMNDRNRGTTYAGMVCGIVGTVLGILVLVVMGGFLAMMVFLQP